MRQTFGYPASDLASLNAGDTVLMSDFVRTNQLTILYVNSHQDCDFAIAEDEDDVLYFAITRLDPAWKSLGKVSEISPAVRVLASVNLMIDCGVPDSLIVRALKNILSL